jgi:hypothetical protein
MRKMAKTTAYCCVCGSALERSSEFDTGYDGYTQEFACASHTEAEMDEFVNEENWGFCSVCGDSIDSETDREQHEIDCNPTIIHVRA